MKKIEEKTRLYGIFYSDFIYCKIWKENGMPAVQPVVFDNGKL